MPSNIGDVFSHLTANFDTGGPALCDTAGQLACLPVDRWAQYAGALNSRNDGGAFYDIMPNSIANLPTSMQGMLVGLGNTIWSLTGQATQLASSLNVLDKAGYAVDSVFAALGSFLLDGSHFLLPGAAIIIAVLGGVIAVWRGAGGRELVKRVIAVLLGMSLFVVGAVQAQASVEAGPDADPAALSPHWIARTLNGFANQAAGQVFDGQIDRAISGAGADLNGMRDDNTENTLDCRRYVAALHDAGRGENGDPTGMTVYRDEVSRMWEQTGLLMWASSQYGSPGSVLSGGGTLENSAQSANTRRAFCRILEDKAGVNPDIQAELTNKAARTGSNGVQDDPANGWAIAFNRSLMNSSASKELNDEGAGDNLKTDRLNTIWQVCQYTKTGWHANPGWDWVHGVQGTNRGIYNGDDDAKDLPANCQAAIHGDYDGQDYSAKPGLSMKDALNQLFDGGGDTAKSALDALKMVPGIGMLASATDNTFTKIKAQGYNFVVNKFDLPAKSNWDVIASRYLSTTNQQGTMETLASMRTVQAMHGNSSLGDIGGSVIFILSGISNLIIWGGLAFLIVASKMMLSLLGLGFYLTLLAWALAPDRGRAALRGMAVQLLGMSLAGFAVTFAGSIVIVFTSLLMAWFGGGSPAWMGLICLVAPIAGLRLIGYVCSNILKIGNPLTLPGMRMIMKGANVGAAAVKMGGGMLGGLAGGIMSGGGLAGALKGMAAGLVNGKGLRGNFRLASSSVRPAGRRDADDRPAGRVSDAATGVADGTDRHEPSLAERAARRTDKDASQLTEDEINDQKALEASMRHPLDERDEDDLLYDPERLAEQQRTDTAEQPEADGGNADDPVARLARMADRQAEFRREHADEYEAARNDDFTGFAKAHGFDLDARPDPKDRHADDEYRSRVEQLMGEFDLRKQELKDMGDPVSTTLEDGTTVTTNGVMPASISPAEGVLEHRRDVHDRRMTERASADERDRDLQRALTHHESTVRVRSERVRRGLDALTSAWRGMPQAGRSGLKALKAGLPLAAAGHAVADMVRDRPAMPDMQAVQKRIMTVGTRLADGISNAKPVKAGLDAVGEIGSQVAADPRVRAGMHAVEQAGDRLEQLSPQRVQDGLMDAGTRLADGISNARPVKAGLEAVEDMSRLGVTGVGSIVADGIAESRLGRMGSNMMDRVETLVTPSDDTLPNGLPAVTAANPPVTDGMPTADIPRTDVSDDTLPNGMPTAAAGGASGVTPAAGVRDAVSDDTLPNGMPVNRVDTRIPGIPQATPLTGMRDMGPLPTATNGTPIASPVDVSDDTLPNGMPTVTAGGAVSGGMSVPANQTPLVNQVDTRIPGIPQDAPLTTVADHATTGTGMRDMGPVSDDTLPNGMPTAAANPVDTHIPGIPQDTPLTTVADHATTGMGPVSDGTLTNGMPVVEPVGTPIASPAGGVKPASETMEAGASSTVRADARIPQDTPLTTVDHATTGMGPVSDGTSAVMGRTDTRIPGIPQDTPLTTVADATVSTMDARNTMATPKPIVDAGGAVQAGMTGGATSLDDMSSNGATSASRPATTVSTPTPVDTRIPDITPLGVPAGRTGATGETAIPLAAGMTAMAAAGAARHGRETARTGSEPARRTPATTGGAMSASAPATAGRPQPRQTATGVTNADNPIRSPQPRQSTPDTRIPGMPQTGVIPTGGTDRIRRTPAPAGGDRPQPDTRRNMQEPTGAQPRRTPDVRPAGSQPRQATPAGPQHTTTGQAPARTTTTRQAPMGPQPRQSTPDTRIPGMPANDTIPDGGTDRISRTPTGPQPTTRTRPASMGSQPRQGTPDTRIPGMPAAGTIPTGRQPDTRRTGQEPAGPQPQRTPTGAVRPTAGPDRIPADTTGTRRATSNTGQATPAYGANTGRTPAPMGPQPQRTTPDTRIPGMPQTGRIPTGKPQPDTRNAQTPTGSQPQRTPTGAVRPTGGPDRTATPAAGQPAHADRTRRTAPVQPRQNVGEPATPTTGTTMPDGTGRPRQTTQANTPQRTPSGPQPRRTTPDTSIPGMPAAGTIPTGGTDRIQRTPSDTRPQPDTRRNARTPMGPQPHQGTPANATVQSTQPAGPQHATPAGRARQATPANTRQTPMGPQPRQATPPANTPPARQPRQAAGRANPQTARSRHTAARQTQPDHEAGRQTPRARRDTPTGGQARRTPRQTPPAQPGQATRASVQPGQGAPRHRPSTPDTRIPHTPREDTPNRIPGTPKPDHRILGTGQGRE